MDEMHRVVERAVRRMGLSTATRMLCRGLIGLGVFVCLAIVADRLFFLGAGVGMAILAAAGLTVLAVVAMGFRRWPTRLEAALEIDGRLRLAERVSSALSVEGSAAPMARAVVADARAYARMAPVAATFPLRLHREFAVVLGLTVLSLALHAWMPQMDLLARRRRQEERRKEQEVVKREGERMRRELVRLRKGRTLEGESPIAGHLEKMDQVIREMEQGKMMPAEAMAKLSELGEALREASKNLAQKAVVPPAAAEKEGLDMTRKLAEALAQKDFAAAAAQLRELAQQAASDKLSPEEKEKLATELKSLAKALEESKELSEALRCMGAAAAEGDKQALAKSLGKLDLELDKLAQLEAELALLKACAGMCKEGKSGLCLGQGLAAKRLAAIYSQGAQRGSGPGMGGPGIGRGGTAPVQPENVQFGTAKLEGQIQPGRVVGSFFSDGRQLKGEAKAAYTEEVKAARAEANQALEQEQIPRAYCDLVRDYFDGMKTE